MAQTETSKKLKMWAIPKIEDCNNFGESVQESVIAVIQLVEIEQNNYPEQVSCNYAFGGKLIYKVCKYPYIIDYRCAVEGLDERQYLFMPKSRVVQVGVKATFIYLL